MGLATDKPGGDPRPGVALQRTLTPMGQGQLLVDRSINSGVVIQTYPIHMN